MKNARVRKNLKLIWGYAPILALGVGIRIEMLISRKKILFSWHMCVAVCINILLKIYLPQRILVLKIHLLIILFIVKHERSACGLTT